MKAEKSVRVLVVDDKPANLQSLEALLEPLDYQVVTADSGEAALRCVLEHDFAVILLDVQMPGMDGFETARLIRVRESSRQTPIIFVTAEMDAKNMVTKGYSLGAVDYLIKPLVPEILRAKVQALVDLSREQKTRLEQLERELQFLSQLSEEGATTVTAELFGDGSIAHTLPMQFEALVKRYGELLDQALERRAFKEENSVSEDLRSMAEQLGFLRAGPRDVIEIHSTALRTRTSRFSSTFSKAQAYVAEGRLAVLELMGHLAAYFRRHSTSAFSRMSKSPSRNESS